MGDIYTNAKQIVQHLQQSGFTAYFAGGWVRDYVMGHPSEDIDIATDATPEQIIALFSQTILVGLAFGVVIVVKNGHHFEIATFRKDLSYKDGRRPEGIELSSPIEDAQRRDFTINGMFYNPITDEIHDYIQGQEDIQKKIIRTIGDPYERFTEDRLRLLRAFRFSARFQFAIEARTLEAIRANAKDLFPSVAIERVWQELSKMALYPHFDQALLNMYTHHLLLIIFPELAEFSLEEINQKVSVYSSFSFSVPPLVYIMELFSHLTTREKVAIAKRLKVSNQEIKLLEFIDKLRHAVEQENTDCPCSDFQWVNLFAHPDYAFGLTVVLARYPSSQREHLVINYQQRFHDLYFYIEQLQLKKPLITSNFLFIHGIKPGRKMGKLLDLAHQIAVNHRLVDALTILSELKNLPIWTQIDE